ncbi:MAG TPA: 50S ribosomal protein L5 [Candidatus Kapabacteria bacterium]|nr:50S ribosomal protein L5 [Candidatus Kapabacteria bacterium]
MAKEKKQKAEAKPEKGQEKAGKAPAEAAPTPRLHTKYTTEVIPALMKRFSYKNVNQVPRLAKITINMGVGAASQDPKLIQTAATELEMIAGQKPAIAKSKKAISNFKLRQNQAIGCHVTLRRAYMYEFMDRLVSLAMPRVRDFRGLPDKSFDGRGNYTMGLKEQIVFPEIDVDKVVRINGMDITFVTTARTDEEAYELLKSLGFPFIKRETVVEQSSKAAA